ncbi:unnamed protein product [Linum trigynum]|uniref:Uncharacterized protein n=1 Tax=Linum trigynum TaxID=586398 RepID=A0AAV2GXF4_9ROSI
MLSLEVWSFEMMVLLAGLLPDPKLQTSVLSISFNICAMIYMLPLGIGAAVSTRVSNELGNGRPRAARLAVCVAFAMVSVEAISVGMVLVGGRNVWGHLYSKENRVKLGAFVNLGAYYLLGVPCSIVLAFVYHKGGKGLWIGLTVAVFSQAMLMGILTVRTNWEKEAKKANDRVYKNIVQDDEHPVVIEEP